MAVATASETIKSCIKVEHYDFDPDATTATDIAWVDMRDYGAILVSVFRTVGTSNLTFKLLANSQSNGSGTDVEIKAHALASQPDAVGDYVFLELRASELLSAGADLRYVSANISAATATDECVVTYVRTEPRFAYSGLTADSIA